MAAVVSRRRRIGLVRARRSRAFCVVRRRLSHENGPYLGNGAAGQAKVSGSRQHRVDAWFAAHVGTWDAMYTSRDVAAKAYQTRQEVALGWIDGLPLGRPARVLELGCGAGRATVALAKTGFTVTASDTV